MKAKIKYLFTLIIILYFSNSWEIEAEYQVMEIPVNYELAWSLNVENHKEIAQTMYANEEAFVNVQKDGVVVRELRESSIKLEIFKMPLTN